MMAIKTQDKEKHGKRYSATEKEEILEYYKKNGYNNTLTEFEISHGSLTNWINKLLTPTPAPTPTPKKSIMEEIMERRTGLSESKQNTPTPTTPTPTPTSTPTPTTRTKMNNNKLVLENPKKISTPTSTPTFSTPTPTTPTKITPTPTKNEITNKGPEIKSLTFEQIVEKLIACSKNSSLRDNKMIAESFEAKGRNPAFQSKRIKDSIRLLLDSGIKFVQEGN